jgi:hypothetical protein
MRTFEISIGMKNIVNYKRRPRNSFTKTINSAAGLHAELYMMLILRLANLITSLMLYLCIEHNFVIF